MHPSVRIVLLAMLALALAAGPAAAGPRSQRAQLEQAQAAYAAAVRWGEFEDAWQFVDPAHRVAHPLTGLELERYRQLRVSGYRDLGSRRLADGSVARNVEIGVINRHTQVERTLRYAERWRWDPEARHWWLLGGLPDFWDGE